MRGALSRDCETETIDFKEDKASPGDMERLISEAAICFANTAGGAVIVGVSDKKRGQDALTGTNLDAGRLKRRVYELSRPHLVVDVERHPKYQNILLVIVPQSSDIHSDTQGRAYQRINLNCLPMTPDQQTRLREERRGIDWSAQPSGQPAGSVDLAAWSAVLRILGNFTDDRRRLAKLTLEDILSSLDVLSSRDELNRAGELLFCRDDNADHSGVLYQYRNTPGGEPKAVQRFGPPLVLAFLKTMELISNRQSLTSLNLPSGQQLSIEDFPSLAIREALSNAICHRDYHLSGQVVIDHSPEALIVTSPGPLVSGVTPSNIITTTSRPRNPCLAKTARILGLAEELGRGVDRMYREMIRSGRQVPQIGAQFDHVRVALVGGAPDTRIARFVASLPEDEREDTDTMLILYRLCGVRTVTASTAAPWLQKSTDEAEVVLRRLASDAVNLLERTRHTIGRSMPTYRLRSDALRNLGSAVIYQRRTTDEIDRKVIAHVREYGKITNRTLQNFFEVDVFKARDIITDLVQREVLVRISKQARGPKVEWGPGVKFPVAKRKRIKRDVTLDS
jgi:ATP-dependent DNA helicase RecG